jgi:hypothetical protein
MLKKTGAICALLLAGAVLDPTVVQAQQRVQTGILTCDVSGGIGLIIGSQKSVNCIFAPSQPGRAEVYQGTISKLGVDIGVTTGGQMIWAVFSPTSAPYGGLAGNYVGAAAEATVAAGLGADVLVGGSNRSVALQPLSISGQTGLNVAAGVAELRLQPVR